MTGPRIEIVRGDITTQRVDAIVNAANATLLGGGGVDGAIHRAGGPAILEACRELRRTTYADGLPIGWAAATTAGDLPARWVIHTVGPVYATDPDPRLHLAQCYGSALRVADHVGARSLAFPSISTGAYGYPVDEAAGIALLTVTTVPTEVTTVRFVLFDEATLAAFERAHQTLARHPVDPEVAARAAAAPLPIPTDDPAGWVVFDIIGELIAGLPDLFDIT